MCPFNKPFLSEGCPIRWTEFGADAGHLVLHKSDDSKAVTVLLHLICSIISSLVFAFGRNLRDKMIRKAETPAL